jgi:hypothetical protein
MQIEDAQAAMALYRLVQADFEKAVRMGHLHGIRPKVESSTSNQVKEEGEAYQTEKSREDIPPQSEKRSRKKHK